MLDYGIDLLNDAPKVSLFSTKAIHAILLCRIEHDEGSGWSDTDRIAQIDKVHAQKHSLATNGIAQKLTVWALGFLPTLS